jgi:hypothetical protein
VNPMVMLLFAFTVVQPAADYDLRLAVVVWGTDGTGCMATADDSLRADQYGRGSPVTFVSPREPHGRSYSALVVDRVPQCAGLPGVTGSKYALRTVGDETVRPSVYIGVIGSAEIRADATGSTAFRVIPAREFIGIRGCSANGQTHLTAWAGAPLTGTRVWHRTVPGTSEGLPRCTDAEQRPLAAVGRPPR